MSGNKRPVVVHITADFPDAVSSAKTRAISALIEQTDADFAHRIYSLNRVGGNADAWIRPGKVHKVADDGRIASWQYSAPSKSIFLARSMRGVARAILADLDEQRIRPCFVHAHKLSFEGIAARAVASALGVRFGLTLQGNTDQKLARLRWDLGGRYRRLWHEAETVIAFSPWIDQWCTARWGQRDPSAELLPCVPIADRIIPDGRRGAPFIATAFNLDDWQNKNIGNLIAAAVKARAIFPKLRLEIAGSGSQASQDAVGKLIARYQAAGFVQCIGRLQADSIQDWMSLAAVFALPSRRESFGMVFLEALLAGTPVIFPAGAAIDGWFEDKPFARAVNAASVDDLAKALIEILQHEKPIRASLRQWQLHDAAEFQRDAIIARYRDLTSRAVSA